MNDAPESIDTTTPFANWRHLASVRADIMLRNGMTGTLFYANRYRDRCKVGVRLGELGVRHVWINVCDITSYQDDTGGWIALLPWPQEFLRPGQVLGVDDRSDGEPTTLRQLEDYVNRRSRFPNLVS